jgi:Family of unknown function (DUF5947)
MNRPPFETPPMVGGHRHLAGEGRAAVVSRLRRLQVRNTAEPAGPKERCDFCAAEITPQHRHVLDTHDRRILCVCEPCSLTLHGQGRYRPTGRRLLRLEEFRLSDELWARFAIPVGLAFFFVSSHAERVLALYPSPLGATESELDLSAWEELLDANPKLGGLEPDAEALLVSRMGTERLHYIVPIDRCYELVGLVRSNWRGISGGDEADRVISNFFERIDEQAQAQ